MMQLRKFFFYLVKDVVFADPVAAVIRIRVQVAVDAALELVHVLHAFVPHEGGGALAAYAGRAVHEHFLALQTCRRSHGETGRAQVKPGGK